MQKIYLPAIKALELNAKTVKINRPMNRAATAQ
jgi:hypothetical protein